MSLRILNSKGDPVEIPQEIAADGGQAIEEYLAAQEAPVKKKTTKNPDPSPEEGDNS